MKLQNRKHNELLLFSVYPVCGVLTQWQETDQHEHHFIVFEEPILMKTRGFASLLHGSQNCILRVAAYFLRPTGNSGLVSPELLLLPSPAGLLGSLPVS